MTLTKRGEIVAQAGAWLALAIALGLILAAAAALRDSLTTALDAAEIECATDGCSSIAVIDGHCAADDERLNTRRAG